MPGNRTMILSTIILEVRLSGVRASITIVHIRKFYKFVAEYRSSQNSFLEWPRSPLPAETETRPEKNSLTNDKETGNVFQTNSQTMSDKFKNRKMKNYVK